MVKLSVASATVIAVLLMPAVASATVLYFFFNIAPMHVSKTGVFSGVYEFVVAGSVITRETFAGKIKNRTAKGTFQAQYDPGGIQYGYCGNMTGEPYTAKG